MKQGTTKFKGKLPFKCFKCGRVGHFASKCPYGKISKNDEEEEEPPKNKKYQKIHKGNWLKNKNIYSREDSSSFDEDDSDSDYGKVLFMAFEEAVENNEDDNEEEGELDLEAALISALSELKRERKKNKQLKEELRKNKESIQGSNPEETKKVFMDLKVKLEESKKIEETLREQLEEKERIQVELENEIVSLRRKLQRKDAK